MKFAANVVTLEERINGGRPTDIMTKEIRDQVKDGTVDWDEVLGKNE